MTEASGLFADGEAYERVMGRWSLRVGEIFLDWLDVPKGLRWLDVGCGNGAFAEVVVSRASPASVVAVDPSEGQLAYARTRAGAKPAQFRVADAQSLPLANDSFDVAAMALVISFIPDPAKAVAEMARVVRPGGWVATYMWDFASDGVPVAPIYRAARSLGMPLSLPPSAPVAQQDAMQALWDKAGLTSVETRAIRIPVEFSDFEDFWNSHARPVGPQGKLMSSLSPEAREQLRAELRRQLPTAADGRIAYEACANAVKGRLPE